MQKEALVVVVGPVEHGAAAVLSLAQAQEAPGHRFLVHQAPDQPLEPVAIDRETLNIAQTSGKMYSTPPRLQPCSHILH